LAGGEETMNEFETKQAIVAALMKFPSSPLGQSASDLLGVLGYTSKKRLALKPNTLATFLATFSQGRSLNERYALPNEWKSVDILFQLTDEEVRTAATAQFEFESKGAFSGAIINSYLFIAIELKGEHYSRSALAGITREVNKLFTMPALIFFRHGETITLAVINRRLHKREPGKDVLEKVTLIQDVRLTNTHRAHIEILYDLSLSALHQKHPFTNFVGLHEAWQKTLDTSELNKRFFQDLANWYFWALPQVRFPKNAPKDVDGRDSLSLIRLITRVIFCWFLKEKGLLPSVLFDEHKIPELLVDLSSKESTYYKAILQNLFFATLNQEMGKREFRRTGQNFMAHNVYRYRSLLKSPNDLLNLSAQIPFMNGGLFECLDKTLGTKENPHYIRIDGLSDRDDNVLKIPNSLFWGPEKVVDLSEAYGEDKYSASRVAGLILIFNRYKFTVAENTPIDEEIALDPELLGKVFENLLAAYNPETGATARKKTGSFYTPREIVNYMVDESLISSLRPKLEANRPGTKAAEDRLRHLFAYNDQAHQFSEPEVIALIEAIDHLKIIDPACGSGAFPMGILHKLVFVLAKLDPGNQRWKERQLAKANEIPDSTVRERVLADIEQTFNANELDYGRKLYLIENCIYGVDIQSIAVQISKLRFFISLVVEQVIRVKDDNLGIRPLPNLETKFVAANTLIGLQRPGQQLLRNLDIEAKEVELRNVRERHFLARTPATKTKCREQDAKLRAEIADMLKGDGWGAATATKLAAWDPYDQNGSADFFDPEWMFGLIEGFDLAIGNPPYVFARNSEAKGLTNDDKQYFYDHYALAEYQINLYPLFIERGTGLLNSSGVLCFITPNNWLTINTNRSLRRFVLEKSDITIMNFYTKVFESAAVDSSIITYRKSAGKSMVRLFEYQDAPTFITETDVSTFLGQRDHIINIDAFKGFGVSSLLLKIETQSDRLKSIADVKAGLKAYEVGTGTPAQTDAMKRSRIYHSTKRIDKSYIKYLDGKDVCRYRLDWSGEFLKYGDNLAAPRKDFRLYSSERILVRQIPAKPPYCIHACYVAETVLNDLNSINVINLKEPAECVLGILNSRLISFWFVHKFGKLQRGTFPQFKVNELAEFPLPKARNLKAVEITKLANQILAAKSKDSNARTESLEMEIDAIVYSLYGLTSEEIRIIEELSPPSAGLAESTLPNPGATDDALPRV
jgi:type I restriction-modification system DNA methylase subunit